MKILWLNFSKMQLMSTKLKQLHYSLHIDCMFVFKVNLTVEEQTLSSQLWSFSASIAWFAISWARISSSICLRILSSSVKKIPEKPSLIKHSDHLKLSLIHNVKNCEINKRPTVFIIFHNYYFFLNGKNDLIK